MASQPIRVKYCVLHWALLQLCLMYVYIFTYNLLNLQLPQLCF